MRSVLDLALQVDWSDSPGWHYENEVYETGRSLPPHRRQIALHAWRLLVTLTMPSQPELRAIVTSAPPRPGPGRRMSTGLKTAGPVWLGVLLVAGLIAFWAWLLFTLAHTGTA